MIDPVQPNYPTRNKPLIQPYAVSIIIGIMILLTLHILAIILELTPVRNQGKWDLFWDCDSYVWLKRTLDFYQYGGWYPGMETYLSHPQAMEMHWTRPVDLIMLSGAWLGSIFTDFQTALEHWGRIFAPLLHLISLPMFHLVLWLTTKISLYIN